MALVTTSFLLLLVRHLLLLAWHLLLAVQRSPEDESGDRETSDKSAVIGFGRVPGAAWAVLEKAHHSGRSKHMLLFKYLLYKFKLTYTKLNVFIISVCV